MPFMDALSNQTARALADENRPRMLDVLGQPAGFRPGYAVASRDYVLSS